MTVLSAQSIRERCITALGYKIPQAMIAPFSEAKQALGMSYGLSACGYDIRLGKLPEMYAMHPEDKPTDGSTWKPTKRPAQSTVLRPGDFILASSLERFILPNDICAELKDKSTLARRGVAVQNTILEPGWEGYLTIEISNHGIERVQLRVGQPIGQLVFSKLDHPTELPYKGKYQNQDDRPVEAIILKGED